MKWLKNLRSDSLAGGRLRVELVEPRGHDGPHQLFEVELVGDEIAGQGLHQLRIARRIGRPQVVDRLDQAVPQQVRNVAVHDRLGEVRVRGRGQPFRQAHAAVARIIRGRAVERFGLEHLARPRVDDFAGAADDHHRLAAEEAELLARLGPHAGEIRGERVVVVLPVVLKRMMVAAGTLQADAEEELGRRLGTVGRIGVDAEVIGRPDRVDRTLGRDQLSHELVERLVRAERLAEPVVEGPHSLLAEIVALVADQVGPLERPPGGVGIVVHVELRIAGEPQQAVDQAGRRCGSFDERKSRVCRARATCRWRRNRPAAGRPRRCRVREGSIPSSRNLAEASSSTKFWFFQPASSTSARREGRRSRGRPGLRSGRAPAWPLPLIVTSPCG